MHYPTGIDAFPSQINSYVTMDMFFLFWPFQISSKEELSSNSLKTSKLDSEMSKDEMASLLSNDWTWHFSLSSSNSTQSDSASLSSEDWTWCILPSCVALLGLMRNAKNITGKCNIHFCSPKFFTHFMCRHWHWLQAMMMVSAEAENNECKSHHEEIHEKYWHQLGIWGLQKWGVF